MKGFWFTIEAVIGGVLLVTFLSFLAATTIEVPPEDLTPLAYKTLDGLNKQGLLKEHAVAGNHTAINNQIRIANVKHSVEICTLVECVGEKPSGGNVWVGTYIIPGHSEYNPREVKLYLFR